MKSPPATIFLATVKSESVEALPAGVVTVILPCVAPAGTFDDDLRVAPLHVVGTTRRLRAVEGHREAVPPSRTPLPREVPKWRALDGDGQARAAGAGD